MLIKHVDETEEFVCLHEDLLGRWELCLAFGAHKEQMSFSCTKVWCKRVSQYTIMNSK